METSPLVLAAPAAPAAPDAPVCASCGTPLAGAYCHACGEKRLDRHDYTFRHFLEHALDTLTHVDLRVVRDLGQQLFRPGSVAAEWLHGRRVRHALPVQLFVVANVLFFLIVGKSGFSPFQTPLQYHFVALHGGLAQRLVAGHLARTGQSLPAFTARFNELAHLYSKSLVFLFIPLLALPLFALFWRQRRYFVEWLTLSAYLFGGMLLLYGLLAAASLLAPLSAPLGVFFTNDELITPVMFTLTTLYAGLFFRRVFPGAWGGWRWLNSFLFTLAFLVALIIPYRFVLFLVCYWAAS